MKKFLSTFRIGVALLLSVFSSNLLSVATAYAAPQPFTAESNNEIYWENLGYGTCTKVENPGGTSYTLPAPQAGTTWSLLVVKASTVNEVYVNPTPGTAYNAPLNDHGTPRDVSHVIYCSKTVPQETDVCPNIADIQTSVPAGMVKDSQGNCVTDICPNIPEIQLTVPLGMIKDNTGNCVPIVDDVCPNLSDVQATIPTGMVKDAQGNCVTDVCPNITDIQLTVPRGMTKVDGNCVDKKVFVCKYVGTPGIDERLQTGQNPISVSVNSIQNNQWNGVVPGWFSDAHDRSYVLAYDTGQPEPSAENCPAHEADVVTPAAPTFVEPTCENPVGRITIHATTGVTYKVGGVVKTGTFDVPAGSAVTVTAEALNSTYKLAIGAAASWSHTFNAAPTNCGVLGDDDVCPNITGSQATVPAGMVKDAQGNCVTDVCPNVAGIQTSVPLGSTKNSDGDCVAIGQTLGTSTALPAVLPATGGTSVPNPLLSLVAGFITYLFLYKRNKKAEA